MNHFIERHIRPLFNRETELQNPLQTRLLEGERIYEQLLPELRAFLKDKKVVFIDLDGVLRSYDDGGKVLNPQTKKTLEAFQKSGYTCVLWTMCPIETAHKYLQSKDLSKFFTLTIGRENFLANTEETQQPIIRAITETPWLTEADAHSLMYTRPEKSKYLFDQRLHFTPAVKPFFLLTEFAVLLDDEYSIVYEDETSEFKDVFARFPVIFLETFGTDYQAESKAGRPPLSPALVPVVDELFHQHQKPE